ncbi:MULTISPECIES: hypothetical protein [Arthrobacter]|uniref:Uncharacterized protein n=1 Tax=Arthrobacter terricola TaxID=2547396 RepID=A0A4R5K926_9MICC|nr:MULTISPECIES: hypothetical protein [Arthrobacter]MBT8163643.1 hypothetical protein [Arthrobacter sp. GN70]TDF88349.1 hypothetical protein E1809_24010 [Arthrobacter terricola]
MSEKSASQAEEGIDRLLAEAGLDEAYEIRDELLELRALASSMPQPSAEVLALMNPTAQAATTHPSTAEAAPFDELAARRRRKRRAGIAALAVAASLAAGATAAAASDGGIPGTIQHLETVVGTVVSQFVPGSGAKAPQTPVTPSDSRLAPAGDSTSAVTPAPTPTASDAPRNSEQPRETPETTSPSMPSNLHKGLGDLSKAKPAPIPVPSPVLPGPGITLPPPVPSDLLPSLPAKP